MRSFELLDFQVTDADPDAGSQYRTLVRAAVTQGGSPAEGLEVACSRSISGRRLAYLGEVVTDAAGSAEIEIVLDPRGAFRRIRDLRRPGGGSGLRRSGRAMRKHPDPWRRRSHLIPSSGGPCPSRGSELDFFPDELTQPVESADTDYLCLTRTE